MELESVTGEIDGGFEREAVGTKDFEAKLSGIALGGDGESEEQKSDDEVEYGAHVSERGNRYANSFVAIHWVTKGNDRGEVSG